MISKKEVQHIAQLARIGLSDEENKRLQKDISSILEYFEMIKRVETKKINPSFYIMEDFLSLEKITRQDKVREKGEWAERLISLAPLKEKRYIKVKAVFN